MTIKAELINHMGTDLTVVNAARVSFAKESDEINTGDKKLLTYLAEGGHFTPFTHVTITMRETVPIFVARQRFKHTVGFSYNEESRRYIDSDPDIHTPIRWRKRPDQHIKQGSGGRFSKKKNDKISLEYELAMSDAVHTYKKFIDKGVAPEQARMVLPMSLMTSYYVTGSLAAWARAYKLRIDSHAQKEIQWLAADWDQIIHPLFTHSWFALTEMGE